MNSLNYKYCDSLLNYNRQNSRVVNIGYLPGTGSLNAYSRAFSNSVVVL